MRKKPGLFATGTTRTAPNAGQNHPKRRSSCMAWACKTLGHRVRPKKQMLQSNSIEHKIMAKWVR
jgi:hypothetical protein